MNESFSRQLASIQHAQRRLRPNLDKRKSGEKKLVARQKL